MRGSLELMNQKDAVIQSLQSQLLESTHTADELIHIQTQLQNLQHRYSLLQNEHVNSKCLIQSKVEASEKTISNLKGEISLFQRQIKDRSSVWMEHQHQMTSLKDQRMARDNQVEMLRYEAEGLKADGEALDFERGKCENSKILYENQLREIQGDLAQLEQTKMSVAQRSSTAERQKQSLRIESQKLTSILYNYQNQNNKLAQQLRQNEEDEKANLAQTTVMREQLLVQELLQTQLQNRLTRDGNEMEKILTDVKDEKDRTKEIVGTLRSKCVYKDNLHAGIQNQQKERNFLLQKNGQIAEINQKLKTDFQLCVSHLANLKSTVESQKELLQRLGKQDQKIVETIQNRRGLSKSKSSQKLSLSRTTTGFGSIKGNLF